MEQVKKQIQIMLGEIPEIIKRFLIFCSIGLFISTPGISIYKNILSANRETDSLSYFKQQAALLTGEELVPHRVSLKSSKTGYYFTTTTGEILLFSRVFAPYASGYGGPIELLVLLGQNLSIKKIHILKHNETPEWIDKTAEWMKTLEGNLLVRPDPLSGIDGVTGATYTTNGILTALKKTGSHFERIINHGESVSNKITLFQFAGYPFFLLSGLMVIALVIRKKPKKWLRLLYMTVVVLLLGFWQNLQFSTYHITTLSTAAVHIKGFDINLFFFIVLPVVIIFTGNIYCGYLCPFGLLQELVSEITFFVSIKISPKVDSPIRRIKYLFLVLILISHGVEILKPLAGMDILLSAFSAGSNMLIFVLVILALSALSNRFWCKYLCPTGAFLSILHGISIFLYKKFGKKIPIIKKIFKIPHVKKCDLGIRTIKENDCICCDRCRYAVSDSKGLFQRE